MANFLARALGVGTMGMTLAMGLQPLGCGSTSTSVPPKLQSNWIRTYADGNGATVIDIKSDNSYVFAILEATSDTSFNTQTETGQITVSGSTLTFTPQAWSCQEPTDPAYSAGFTLSGDSLSIAFPSGITVLKLNTASADGSSTGLSLRNGCFVGSDTFVASPLTPVGSCGLGGGDCSAASATCCNGYACTNGGICSAICTADTGCKSGCCPQASTPGNLRLCAPATACK